MLFCSSTQSHFARSTGASLRLSSSSLSYEPRNLTQQAGVWRQQRLRSPIRGSRVLGHAQEKEQDFFGREIECKVSTRYLESKPSAILLILGPRNSGKTALLQKVLRSLPKDEQAYPPLYLDGRVQQLSDAGELTKALQASGDSALWQLSERPAAFADSPLAYNDVLAFHKSVKVSNSSWPIICIDEANVQTEGQEGASEEKRALKELLRFFVKASKQDNSAHIVLATTDYSFIGWLAEEIGYGFFIIEVIGDFPEEEACRFTASSLARAGKSTHLTDDDWHRVYEVCGGNAGQLGIAVSSYWGDWRAGMWRSV